MSKTNRNNTKNTFSLTSKGIQCSKTKEVVGAKKRVHKLLPTGGIK
ncbi:hypothetical protein VCHA53O466_50330 [Vibrio chagasii]|nr:hypothetical protein VCHA53O466_50330 [Vibrio chagasii]